MSSFRTNRHPAGGGRAGNIAHSGPPLARWRLSNGIDAAGGSRRGFTLIEILIILAVLGTLALAVLPHVTRADDDSRRAVFISDLNHFRQGLDLHATETGGVIDNTPAGVCPDALKPFIDVRNFESNTSLGGQWDVEVNASGITLAVGVDFTGSPTLRNDADMISVDRLCDDGDLTTGHFRKLGEGRYYWVLED